MLGTVGRFSREHHITGLRFASCITGWRVNHRAALDAAAALCLHTERKHRGPSDHER
jgi:hypothetical protein